MGWYAIFYREMVILWRKIGRWGYAISSILSPFIYLLAFGLGLGGKISIDGGYLPFLAAGIVGITIMMNAFQQTASSISVGRLFFKSFQSVVLSPISAPQVIFGIVLAGMVRSIVSGLLIFAAAWLIFNAAIVTPIGLAGVLLGAFCFSSLGAIVGLKVHNPDDIAMVNNFFIMPMTFFGGSFFPLHNLPPWLGMAASFFPIGSINVLLRSTEWNFAAAKAVFILLALGGIFFGCAVWIYSRYSE